MLSGSYSEAFIYLRVDRTICVRVFTISLNTKERY